MKAKYPMPKDLNLNYKACLNCCKDIGVGFPNNGYDRSLNGLLIIKWLQRYNCCPVLYVQEEMWLSGKELDKRMADLKSSPFWEQRHKICPYYLEHLVSGAQKDIK